MSPTIFVQSPHGLACDGCGIAKDDLLAIETMETQERGIHEVFHNAARIHKAMRSNRLLIPIFRKYRETCREILQQKKEEAEQFAILSAHCDNPTHAPHQANHDLKCIKTEMREIHNKIKSLEEMKWTDDDSDSSCSSCSSDCSDSEDEPAIPFHGGGDANSVHSSSSDSGSSSLSESGSESDLSDVMEFLRQSQVDE